VRLWLAWSHGGGITAAVRPASLPADRRVRFDPSLGTPQPTLPSVDMCCTRAWHGGLFGAQPTPSVRPDGTARYPQTDLVRINIGA